MKVFNLLVFFIFFAVNLFSQKDFKPGYIITLENDTLYGTINLRANIHNHKACEFKASGSEETKIYEPFDIFAYRIIDNKYYVSKEVVMDDISTRLFLEFLVDGIVDLYFLKDGNGDQYFIEKDDLLVELSNDEVEFFNEYGTLHKSNSNQYRGVLTYLFQEDEAIQRKAQGVQFNLKSLVNFTEDYHNAVCTDQECVNYTKNTKARVFMEPTVGMVYSSMGLNYSDDSNSNINPCFGINFRLVPVKSHYVWSLNLGFNVLKNKFNGSFFNTIFYERGQTFNISTDYLFLQVPIIVKYTYPAKRVQPEVYIGYSNGFLINAKHHITQDVSGVYKVEKESLNRKYHIGFLGGLGVKINLKNSNYLLVKGDYCFRVPGINANYILDHQRVRSVTMGISYGFKL